MEFLYDLGLFVSKAIVIVAAITAVVVLIVQASSGRGPKHHPHLDLEKLTSRLRSFRDQLQHELLSKKELREIERAEKKAQKDQQKNQQQSKQKNGDRNSDQSSDQSSDQKSEQIKSLAESLASDEPSSSKPKTFVIDFLGDIKASAVSHLREEITAILTVAQRGDEIVVRVESGGGMVTSYGLAASQLARLKSRKIQLTVCVDKIAASGGYMMACVADRILAAPFAIVGSIGVVAQIPNFHRVLKRHDIDFQEVTAGQFKRTVSLFGEITEPGMEKFKEQIEATHDLFKTFVASNRPSVDLNKVATGEHWYGTQALDLGLVDEISTSDDYLMKQAQTREVLLVAYHARKKLAERISESFASILHSVATRIWSDVNRARFGG